ncbi:SRPBCC family protein [Polymorphospora sp. NPDC050346]|uniref:SRPBCC family protein n=1 Tax=Polymorphospora sp. NPDC050346 TaxID=3155780 RepID=UPI0033F42F8F
MTNDLSVEHPSDLEITLSRAVDAPRDLVFAAHTQAEHLKHWWGRGNPLDVEIDFRVGGRYRYVEHTPDGESHAFRGEFREIVPNERIVQTFEYEPMAGHILEETVVFEERGGQTVVTSTSRFANKEDRDGMVASGMEDGAAESYAVLDNYLKTLA